MHKPFQAFNNKLTLSGKEFDYFTDNYIRNHFYSRSPTIFDPLISCHKRNRYQRCRGVRPLFIMPPLTCMPPHLCWYNSRINIMLYRKPGYLSMTTCRLSHHKLNLDSKENITLPRWFAVHTRGPLHHWYRSWWARCKWDTYCRRLA